MALVCVGVIIVIRCLSVPRPKAAPEPCRALLLVVADSTRHEFVLAVVGHSAPPQSPAYSDVQIVGLIGRRTVEAAAVGRLSAKADGVAAAAAAAGLVPMLYSQKDAPVVVAAGVRRPFPRVAVVVCPSP